MDIYNINAEVKSSFLKILCIDEKSQEEEILRVYDIDCHLENSYMILQGRHEIVKSYATLAKNNISLTIAIDSVTYDAQQQLIMADIQQIMKPKALGGLMSIHIHFILKIQLEKSEDGKYRIVDHKEIPVAQDLISQMPIVGGWYESTIRNAVGQISLAGSSVLEYTGFLDFAPRAVDATKSTASSIKSKAGSLVSSATRIGGSALAATGVTSVLSGVTDFVKWGAASLIEEAHQEKIDCYSPSCTPGTICYSPTCPRGQQLKWLSRATVHDIIKGAYTGSSKRISFLTASH